MNGKRSTPALAGLEYVNAAALGIVTISALLLEWSILIRPGRVILSENVADLAIMRLVE